ncbi:hypothetical protein H6G54_22760 [Anabaena cylindrica FACHB-243]|uniref:Uncharacterized protein n=1 Tax=Anabaena cylindrica (strain ATCC 27899 / PCC 7122) TaxID=272123 RepID=K9ZNX4_ANACC|nr:MULTISPECIES: hypothetical protein [Anabaena]AFZ60906.1 hypothetical protein Anacy_5598 [Anabaena cylindrica PCC 7122]MBD2420474.1 hypothetical protein [Anabaena cylindrica FACHB-243]MBY5282402.1 hypothetical protein [Anabaena sp. CCAP 1446/1C]MBY5306328.1 hypothetical protein [Anabaena sp. CCAP 1446/1C]MCM2406900.1 hypothetical protein [Anabaena sp. CCAP 1446/1C]
MFGFIKNLIAGILGFITGLFAKKDNGYYLQLNEEATEAKPVATKAKAEPAKATAAKPEAVATKAKAEPAKAPAVKPEPAKVPDETTFAPKYLVPSSSNGRRRPGANMNTYLDMARQVKTPG